MTNCVPKFVYEMSLLMTGFTLVRGLKGIPPLVKILTTSLTEIVSLPISAPSIGLGIPSHKTLSTFKYLQHLKIATLKIYQYLFSISQVLSHKFVYPYVYPLVTCLTFPLTGRAHSPKMTIQNLGSPVRYPTYFSMTF